MERWMEEGMMCGTMDGRGDDVWNDGGCLSGRVDAWIGVWVGEQKLDG